MELSNEAEDLKLQVIFLLSSTVAMNFQQGGTKKCHISSESLQLLS